MRIIALAVGVLLVGALLVAWRANVRDRAQLAADLATAKHALAQADARQHDRDAQLAQSLASLAAEKRSVTTPAQIVRDLPRQIPVPAPITLQSGSREISGSRSRPAAAASNTGPATALSPAAPCSSGLPWSSKGPPSGPEGLDSAAATHTEPCGTSSGNSAVIPEEDLKPLYDFALDCRACQAKLAAAQGDLTDERAKTTILTHERDEAVRVAKGGSALRRVARAAKWLAIGAVAGAIAARAAH